MFVKRSLQKQERVNVAIASNYCWAVEREREKKKKEKKEEKKQVKVKEIAGLNTSHDWD